jgi:hypothetical protein
MSEPMTVRVEIWPVAADDIGIWLISGNDAWRPTLPVMADSDPHAEVELALAEHGVLNDRVFLHSTSWRADGPSTLLTYVAVLRRPGLVREHWADALPISPHIPQAVGKPPTHSPVDAPAPRYIDVLLHGLRHMVFLLGPNGDATAATALTEPWPTHLAPLEPALAGMYSEVHRPA